MTLNVFSCAYLPFEALLWWMNVQIFCPLKKKKRAVCFLPIEIRKSHMYLGYEFFVTPVKKRLFHSVCDLSFHSLSAVSFKEQKFLTLMKSNLSIFFLLWILLLVLCILCEKWLGVFVWFCLSHVDVQLFQHHSLERLPFPHWIALTRLSKSHCPPK